MKIVKNTFINILIIAIFIFNNLALANLPIIDDAPDVDPNLEYVEVTKDNLEDMTAGASILVDFVSGRILYEKDIHKPLYPASTTKMLTAYMAIKYGKLDDIVDVNDEAIGLDGSSLYLSYGDRITLKNLVYGTMITSANDGAAAIAYHLGNGSMEDFIAKMNEEAKKMGAKNTHFTNPHGLPDKEHFSTAYDLMSMARFGMYNPKFRDVVAKKMDLITWTNPADRQDEVYSTNRLMWNYDDVIGIKTGYTEEAGGALVAAATEKDTTLISVVLQTIDARSRFTESRALLDYGFEKIKKRVAINKEDLTTKVYVHNGRYFRAKVVPIMDFSYPLLDGESEKEFSTKLEVDKYIVAPMKKGDVVGKVVLFKNGTEVGSLPLVLDEDVEEGFSLLGFFHKLLFS